MVKLKSSDVVKSFEEITSELVELNQTLSRFTDMLSIKLGNIDMQFSGVFVALHEKGIITLPDELVKLINKKGKK